VESRVFQIALIGVQNVALLAVVNLLELLTHIPDRVLDVGLFSIDCDKQISLECNFEDIFQSFL